MDMMRINLLPALHLLYDYSIGFTKEEYDEATQYIIHIIRHSNMVTAQQSIDFEAVHTEDSSRIVNHKKTLPISCYNRLG